jgi:hypothetical protein
MIEMDIDTQIGGGRHKWWLNFRDHCESEGHDFNDAKSITRALEKWNAIDKDPESTKFYFENEHDYLLFMLRFA